MARPTQLLFVHLEQESVIAAVGFMTGEASIGHRPVLNLPGELGRAVARKAKLLGRRCQQLTIITGVRVVTSDAFAFTGRLVHVSLFKTQVGLLVTQKAELRSFFLQPESADQPMCLMTRQAVLRSKRFVLHFPLKVRHLMAVEAIAFLGKPFAGLNLGLSRTAQAERQGRKYQ